MNDCFSPDKPLGNPKDDLLGYATFSKSLAESIIKMVPSDGLVIALNGEWGAGKTTAINFLLHYINDYDDERKPVVIHFNPWWFSGHEDFTRLLLSTIAVSLGKNDFSQIKNLLADIAEASSKFPHSAATVAGGIFSRLLRKEVNLRDKKITVDKLLLNNRRKILVIIDDVDRLMPDEIRDVLKAIKSVANFPNVIYLLAFDPKIVVEALEIEIESSGKDFLEKIIQVPFELPQPDTFSLHELFKSKLNSVLEGTTTDLLEKEEWINAFRNYIRHFIQTPRDVVRIINALQATYPGVRGEVNSIDFVSIETLRIFEPAIYRIIRSNKEFLVPRNRSFFNNIERDKETDKEIFTEWLAIISDNNMEVTKNLLSYLFPRFSEALSNVVAHSTRNDNPRRLLRICSRELFDLYFHFSPGTDHVSAWEMKRLIDATSNENEFSSILLDSIQQSRRDGSTKVKEILERFQDFTTEIPSKNIPNIVNSFYKVGDHLMVESDRAGELLLYGNDMRIMRIIHQLLWRIPMEERFCIIKQAIEEGNALAMIDQELSVYGQQQGKFTEKGPRPESQWTINSDQLKQLESIAVEKIRLASNIENFDKTKGFLGILTRWKAWSEKPDEVEVWMGKYFKCDNNLLSFIARFLEQRDSPLPVNPLYQDGFRIDLRRLEAFMNIEEIAPRVKEIANSEELLPAKHRIAAEIFTMEFEKRVN